MKLCDEKECVNCARIRDAQEIEKLKAENAALRAELAETRTLLRAAADVVRALESELIQYRLERHLTFILLLDE